MTTVDIAEEISLLIKPYALMALIAALCRLVTHETIELLTRVGC